jgi:uracil-DNA glycosylase family 4
MDLTVIEEYASNCTFCGLHANRNKAVFAKGTPDADIMVCGMAPAHEENKVGTPFVGRAGKLLDEILEDAKLTSNDIYITNIVKCCLAPGISLKQDWINSCVLFLICQIDAVRPKVIITLGKDATCGLLGLDTKFPLGKIMNEGPYFYGNIEVIPTYHPSYLLRGGGKKHKNYMGVAYDFWSAKEKSLDK